MRKIKFCFFKFRIFVKISNFAQIFDFDQIFDYWPKFRFLTKISIFWPNFRFLAKNYDFWPKITIFNQNFNCWRLISAVYRIRLKMSNSGADPNFVYRTFSLSGPFTDVAPTFSNWPFEKTGTSVTSINAIMLTRTIIATHSARDLQNSTWK